MHWQPRTMWTCMQHWPGHREDFQDQRDSNPHAYLALGLVNWIELKSRCYGEPHAHRLENGRQTTEGRIALVGQGAIELGRIEMRLLGYSLHPAERLCHLAQHDQQLGLVPIGQDAVDDFQRQGRIAAVQLGHRVVMGSGSHLQSPWPVLPVAHCAVYARILGALVAATHQQYQAMPI